MSSISNETPEEFYASTLSQLEAESCQKEKWESNETTALTNLLNTSFSNHSILSMRGNWLNLTETFNKETGLLKTAEKVYKKVSSMFTNLDQFNKPFKELISINEASNTQNTAFSLSSQIKQALLAPSKPRPNQPNHYPTSSSSSSSSSSNLPIKEKMQRTSYSCFVGFFKGYQAGKAKYLEEREKLLREKKENTIPSIQIVNLNNKLFYEQDLKYQSSHLGYICAIKRFIDSDQRRLDFNFLYSPELEDLSFIDSSCFSRAVKDSLDRRNFEDQINHIRELNPRTPITPLFEDISSTFKESIAYQIYVLIFTNSIINLNKQRQL
jgi:hypothetical protein